MRLTSWFADGRQIRRQYDPATLVAVAYGWNDSQLIAAAPELAAALKLALNRGVLAGDEVSLVAAHTALHRAGVLYAE